MNLQRGTGPEADVALHVNPRYDAGQPVVVLNSRENGAYGLERKFKHSLFPVGSSFFLSFRVTQQNYQVCDTASRTGKSSQHSQSRFQFICGTHQVSSVKYDVSSVELKKSSTILHLQGGKIKQRKILKIYIYIE